jgi:hypothetical protein
MGYDVRTLLIAYYNSHYIDGEACSSVDTNGMRINIFIDIRVT